MTAPRARHRDDSPTGSSHARVSGLARPGAGRGRPRAGRSIRPSIPRCGTSVDRLRHAVREAGGGQVLRRSASPRTRCCRRHPGRRPREGPITEAAAWLHNRDILQLSFLGDVPSAALHAAARAAAEDSTRIRQRGGPAKVWARARRTPRSRSSRSTSPRSSRTARSSNPARRRTTCGGRSSAPSSIAGSRSTRRCSGGCSRSPATSARSASSRSDVMAPHHTADGSPMLTSQAAAVVAAYRHLVGIVDVMAPERRRRSCRTWRPRPRASTRASSCRCCGRPDEPAGAGAAAHRPASRRGIAGAFDDMKVAQLLATTLAIEGQASARLADGLRHHRARRARKRRVLTPDARRC